MVTFRVRLKVTLLLIFQLYILVSMACILWGNFVLNSIFKIHTLIASKLDIKRPLKCSCICVNLNIIRFERNYEIY